MDAHDSEHTKMVSNSNLYMSFVCVQRISRYPLFINAMMDNTLPDSEERAQLRDGRKVKVQQQLVLVSMQSLCI